MGQNSLIVVSDRVVIPDVQAVSQKGWHPAVLGKFQRPYHEVVIEVCNECDGDTAVFSPKSVEVCDSTVVMTPCFFYPSNSGNGAMTVGLRASEEISIPAGKCCQIEYRIEQSVHFQSDILSYRDRHTTQNLFALCFDEDTLDLAKNIEFQMVVIRYQGESSELTEDELKELMKLR